MNVNIDTESANHEERLGLCNTSFKNGSTWNLSKIAGTVGLFAILICNLAVSSSTLANQKSMKQSQPYVSDEGRTLMSPAGELVGTAGVLRSVDSLADMSDIDIMMTENIKLSFPSNNATIDFYLKPSGISMKQCASIGTCKSKYIYTFYTSEGNIVQDGDDTYIEEPSDVLQKALTEAGGSIAPSRKLWMDEHGHRKLWFIKFASYFLAASRVYRGGQNFGWW